MTPVVPPHKVWEGPNPVFEAFNFTIGDREVAKEIAARWHEALDALLPPHKHLSGSCRTWSTPAGVWHVETESSGYGYPRVTVSGPGGKLVLADINIEHIRSVLTVLGAIEPREDLPC